MGKIDFTKLAVKGTEWFSNLALLNLFWLFFSLPIVTLIPATDAVFDVLHQWESEGKSESVFNHFKAAFKTNFKSSFKFGIPILLITIIGGVDLYFLNGQTIMSPWFQVLKYAFYFFTVIVVLAILYAYPLMKRTGENHIRLLAVGLLTAVGYPLTTLGVVGSLLVATIIFLIWPSMLFFFSVSFVAWLMTKAVSNIAEKNQEKQVN